MPGNSNVCCFKSHTMSRASPEEKMCAGTTRKAVEMSLPGPLEAPNFPDGRHETTRFNACHTRFGLVLVQFLLFNTPPFFSLQVWVWIDSQKKKKKDSGLDILNNVEALKNMGSWKWTVLACFFVTVIKHCNQKQLREERFTWLTN